MKLHKISLLALSLSCASAQAVTTTVDFDDLTHGAMANGAAGVSGFTLSFATTDTDYDSFGDPIPGSDHYVADGSATVGSPATLGYGTGSLALNADAQPVTIQFDTTVVLNGFQVTLDNSVFGQDLFSAGFYSSSNVLLGSTPVFQTSPGSIVSASGLTGVSYIVLPSGALYDHLVLDFTPVPEPGAAGLLLVAMAPLARRRRRAR